MKNLLPMIYLGKTFNSSAIPRSQAPSRLIFQPSIENHKRDIACASRALGDLNLETSSERAAIILRSGG